MLTKDGELKIFFRRAKNGTFYHFTFLNNEFKFVRLKKSTISTCPVSKAKNGETYITYKGEYTILDTGVIEINSSSYEK